MLRAGRVTGLQPRLRDARGQVAAGREDPGPLLDILQSVPILGFLSITVTGFIALFPGRLLGVECAAIFAIFTSQAWNMAFSFYQSLRTVPADLHEAARMFQLSPGSASGGSRLPYAMPT